MEVNAHPCALNDVNSESLDGASNASTEDSLISSANSETTISSGFKTDCYDLCKKKRKYAAKLLIFGSILFTAFGVSSIIWTPFRMFMNERLKMTPSLPPFKWWKDPPDEVILKVYVFNVTNTEEFLYGNDTKLHIQEIGPIIFREKLTHTNVTFNDNDTLSYTATRKAILLPELNSIDLTSTIYTPNMALLGMASYMSDASYFMKLGFKLMINRLNSQPFVKLSINDYLWNFTDPLLEAGNKLAPSMVPVRNMGVLERIYAEFSDQVTVYIGSGHGDNKFFLIDKYDGSEYMPYLGESCKDKAVNGTEGVLYPQFVTKNVPLRYYRKTMCRVTPLHYEKDDQKYGIPGYRYSLPGNSYDRTFPAQDDCYSSYPPLLNGLTDVSKCQFGMPMVASFPYFLYGDPTLNKFVETDVTATEEEHGSFVIVEPFTGIPMEGKARSQSNLVMQNLSGFNRMLGKFSHAVIPLFWAEYHQVGLPDYVIVLLYFQVLILPIAQWIMTACAFLASTYLLVKLIQLRRSQGLLLRKNTQLHFEHEIFIKDKI